MTRNPYKRDDSTTGWLVIAAIAVLMLALSGAGGCTDAQRATFQQHRQTVEEVRSATTQAIADTESELAVLPVNDPVRAKVETALTQLKSKLEKADAVLTQIDALARAEATGDTAELEREASKLPVVGPYVGLILLVAGWARTAAARARERKALVQTVNGLEAIAPNKTDEQKLKLAAAQDESTRKLVSEIKGD